MAQPTFPITYYQSATSEEQPLTATGDNVARSSRSSKGSAAISLAVLALTAFAGFKASNVPLSSSGPAGAASSSLSVRDTMTNFALASHPFPPDAELWGNLKKPFPTGAWWLNFVLDGAPYPASSYPYAVKAQSDGLTVSYSATRRMVKQKLFADVFAPDLHLTTVSDPTGHYVESYDDLSVTEAYSTADGGSYKLLLVKGAPFVTVQYTACAVKVSPLALFESINGETPVNWRSGSVTASEIKLVLSSGQTWLLFFSEEVTFSYDISTMTMDAPFTGVLRATVLLEPKDRPLLRKYADVYPTGGTVDWSVKGDSMQLSYDWHTASMSASSSNSSSSSSSSSSDGESLLMLALPHHVDVLQSPKAGPAAALQKSFQCIKGHMTPLVGTKWVMKDTLPTIEWDAPVTVDEMDPASVQAIRDQLPLDIASVPPLAPDVYNFGKALARMARLALIADAVGEDELRVTATESLAPFLTPWLDGTNPDALLYDTKWGAIVTKAGLKDKFEDFGNGWMDDHHFQYGYLIYAAAVAIRYDPSFYAKYKAPLDALVLDIANMDPAHGDFPMARHKDFYDFHSWASGLFPQGNGKSQESISEAVNAYYAVQLFGVATNNTKLTQWGRVLTQMELRAGRKYWQMQSGGEIYDPIFASNRMAGVVGALDVVCNTWFGDKLEWIHGIQMMPFTPITEELLKPEFVAEEYPVLAAALDRDSDQPAQEWLGLAYLDEAIVDPQSAWEHVQSLSIFDGGNSRSNSMYWIATRPSSSKSSRVKMAARPAKHSAAGNSCSAHAACAKKGLAGQCCPTDQGVMLGCCA